ncbi:MAG: hypothetical protein WCV62_02550 [Candidatus Peribacteraceae bacterium]|jgi:hypothetical protein
MKQRTVQILSMILFLALLLWGGYGLLSYLGVEVHGMVLFSDAAQKDVAAACPGGGFICRGINGFFPYLLHTFGRASPFLAYAILSIIGYLLFVGWQGVKTGQFRLQMRWSQWQIPVFFTACVWLLFTTLSMGVSDNVSALQLVEPTAQAYGDIGERALNALKENFDRLENRGCLSLLGESGEGIKIYRMKGVCAQGGFLTLVLPQILFIIVLLFEFLVLGRFLLRLLRAPVKDDLQDFALSAGLGACGWITMLWFLAAFGIFRYQPGWALAIFLPILLYRQSLHWIRTFFTKTYEMDRPWHTAGVLLLWLLLSYLALNFLTVVRPFPIGWDDLGSYLNRPRLLVSYGHLIHSMAPFQWEYLTSLGFLLFGYDSIFGAIASMMVNWTAGVLAVLSVILFARTYLGKGAGLLAALLYYSLPLVGHFSFADMKVDNAVFAFGALAMYAAFIRFFPAPAEEEEAPPPATTWRAALTQGWQWMVLAGVFVGFAFATKATAVMVIMAILVLLVGLSHWSAFIGGLFLALFILDFRGPFDIGRILARGGMSMPWLAASFTGLLLVCVAFFFAVAGIRRRGALLPYIGATIVFLLAVAGSVAPWILNNNIQRGNIIPRLELGMQNTLSPVIDIKGYGGGLPGQVVKSLPPELKLDRDNPACTPTGGVEELDRYWGFREGWSHYITLPWRTVMNIDSAGYYVTTIPALLLFPLLLLLPAFWQRKGRWLRWLWIATAVLIVEWMFLANGIPWYGIGMFLGLVIALEALVARAPDALNRGAVATLITFSLIIAFGMRFWQFEQQKNLLEYPFGKVTADTLRIRTIPYYDQIRDIVVQRHETMPDRPYLYRVGTFITYFIPKNLEIIGTTDHQLDTFNCLYQERDPQLTLKRLKALGFNSIIFDTNTATIEKDSEGSLHKKAQAFVDFLNNPSLGLQVVISDANQGVAFILLP